MGEFFIATTRANRPLLTRTEAIARMRNNLLACKVVDVKCTISVIGLFINRKKVKSIRASESVVSPTVGKTVAARFFQQLNSARSNQVWILLETHRKRDWFEFQYTFR